MPSGSRQTVWRRGSRPARRAISNDLWQLAQWGRAGTAAKERLEAAAQAPGGEALAEWLATAESGAVGETESADLRAALVEAAKAVLPVQPASATGLRDSLLMLMQPYELEDIKLSCAETQPGGGRDA